MIYLQKRVSYLVQKKPVINGTSPHMSLEVTYPLKYLMTNCTTVTQKFEKSLVV